MFYKTRNLQCQYTENAFNPVLNHLCKCRVAFPMIAMTLKTNHGRPENKKPKKPMPRTKKRLPLTGLCVRCANMRTCGTDKR